MPSQTDAGFGDEGDGDGDGDEVEGDGDGDSAEPDLAGDDGVVDTGTPSCEVVVDTLEINDDTVPAAVECVEEVLGDLSIGPTTNLVDLSLLANLRAVGGTVYVFGNLSLQSLHGLEQLEQATWVHVRRNHQLDDLSGLEGLVDVAQITVTNNAGLTSVTGLPGGLAPAALEIRDNDLLTSLDGLPAFLPPSSAPAIHVAIEDNPQLTDLGGLSDCCAAQVASLTVKGNDALTDLAGLEAFMRLEALRLHDNSSLVDLSGLDGAVEIRTLDIAYERCDPEVGTSLVDLEGAPNLSKVEVVQIQWASALTNLDGLDGLDSLDKLQVRSNAALPWGEVEAIIAQTDPNVIDACGGVGGPTCVVEPCPMF